MIHPHRCTQIDLRFFHPHEFAGWFPDVSLRLLVSLDALRSAWGMPIRISGAPGAVGRKQGERPSQHNFEKWGEVRAVDCYPDGLTDVVFVESFIQLAQRIGFSGIGIYPMWSGGVGVHLDVRVDRDPGNPATWGKLLNAAGDQYQVSLRDALEVIT